MPFDRGARCTWRARRFFYVCFPPSEFRSSRQNQTEDIRTPEISAREWTDWGGVNPAEGYFDIYGASPGLISK